MKFYEGAIIVEGSNDASYLSSFIKSNFIVLNGYNCKNINFIKEIAKIKRVILLTDSDESGKKIREKVNNNISGLINVELDINKCNKNGKHGVAEADKKEILLKLNQYLYDDETKEEEKITLKDIYLLNKEKILQEYHLDKCNNKTLIKRLNLLGIKKEDLWK